jgi:hypothetical protein
MRDLLRDVRWVEALMMPEARSRFLPLGRVRREEPRVAYDIRRSIF